MSETTSSTSYRRGTGHVLATGHDPSTCTACAYDAGRRDALAEQRQREDVTSTPYRGSCCVDAPHVRSVSDGIAVWTVCDDPRHDGHEVRS